MTKDEPRPGQATLAAWLIIGGSVILVITAWQRVASLHTLEVQDELRRVLSEPPVSGTGLSLDALQTTVRVLSMMAAGAATAAAILGYHAMKRSTSARLALTFLAPLVLVGGFATAGFFAPMVVAGITMLWLRPTRDWYAGRPWLVPTGERDGDRGKASRPDPFAAPPQAPTSAPENPPQPHASQPPAPYAPPQAGAERPEPTVDWPPARAAASYPSVPSVPKRRRRPAALLWACTLVWVCSGLVTGVLALTALVVIVTPDELFAEVERQQISMEGLTRDQLVAAMLVVAGVGIVWSIAAIVLGVLTFNRVGWARITLAVCSGLAAAVMVLMLVGGPFLVVLVAPAVAACVLLLRREVVDWFKR